jgi:hypothetical protein
MDEDLHLGKNEADTLQALAILPWFTSALLQKGEFAEAGIKPNSISILFNSYYLDILNPTVDDRMFGTRHRVDLATLPLEGERRPLPRATAVSLLRAFCAYVIECLPDIADLTRLNMLGDPNLIADYFATKLFIEDSDENQLLTSEVILCAAGAGKGVVISQIKALSKRWESVSSLKLSLMPGAKAAVFEQQFPLDLVFHVPTSRQSKNSDFILLNLSKPLRSESISDILASAHCCLDAWNLALRKHWIFPTEHALSVFNCIELALDTQISKSNTSDLRRICYRFSDYLAMDECAPTGFLIFIVNKISTKKFYSVSIFPDGMTTAIFKRVLDSADFRKAINISHEPVQVAIKVAEHLAEKQKSDTAQLARVVSAVLTHLRAIAHKTDVTTSLAKATLILGGRLLNALSSSDWRGVSERAALARQLKEISSISEIPIDISDTDFNAILHQIRKVPLPEMDSSFLDFCNPAA